MSVICQELESFLKHWRVLVSTIDQISEPENFCLAKDPCELSGSESFIIFLAEIFFKRNECSVLLKPCLAERHFTLKLLF